MSTRHTYKVEMLTDDLVYTCKFKDLRSALRWLNDRVDDESHSTFKLYDVFQHTYEEEAVDVT